jgi:hypothetical protein
MNAFEALSIIAKLEFNFLDDADRQGYAGVESDEALIGYYDNTVVIIDGPMVQFMYEDGEFESFYLK